jgi:hypothetical protein
MKDTSFAFANLLLFLMFDLGFADDTTPEKSSIRLGESEAIPQVMANQTEKHTKNHTENQVAVNLYGSIGAEDTATLSRSAIYRSQRSKGVSPDAEATGCWGSETDGVCQKGSKSWYNLEGIYPIACDSAREWTIEWGDCITSLKRCLTEKKCLLCASIITGIGSLPGGAAKSSNRTCRPYSSLSKTSHSSHSTRERS